MSIPATGRGSGSYNVPRSVGGVLAVPDINAPDRTCVDRRGLAMIRTEPEASVTQRDDAWAILFFVLHDKDNSTTFQCQSG
jgi:hypothetical protein